MRWTCKSTRQLADALGAQGFQVSDDTVGRLLKQQGYTALSGRLQFDPKEGGINLSLVGGFDNAPDNGDSLKLRILGWRGTTG